MKSRLLTLITCLFVASNIHAQKVKTTNTANFKLNPVEKSLEVITLEGELFAKIDFSSYDIPKIKGKLKKLAFNTPKKKFKQLALKSVSNVYETDTDLAFIFQDKAGQGKFIHYIRLNKTSKETTATKFQYPFHPYGSQSNVFLIDSLFFLMTTTGAGVNIDVYNQNDLKNKLASFEHNKTAPLVGWNTALTKSVTSDFIWGTTVKGGDKKDLKKQKKLWNSLLNAGSNWSCKLHVEKIDGHYVLTPGSHFFLTSGPGGFGNAASFSSTTEKMVFYKFVIDQNSLKQISNEELESKGLDLKQMLFDSSL